MMVEYMHILSYLTVNIVEYTVISNSEHSRIHAYTVICDSDYSRIRSSTPHVTVIIVEYMHTLSHLTNDMITQPRIIIEDLCCAYIYVLHLCVVFTSKHIVQPSADKMAKILRLFSKNFQFSSRRIRILMGFITSTM